MTMTLEIPSILIIMSVPSAVTGLCVWLLKRHIDKNEKKRVARETARTEHQIMIIDLAYASLALGEATACALRNGKANGEVTAALNYAKEVKHKHRDFIKTAGVGTLQ